MRAGAWGWDARHGRGHSQQHSQQHPVVKGAAVVCAPSGHRGLHEPVCGCSEWYYARSPFLSPQRQAEILGSLYELDRVTFHLALCRDDLDTAWPMFSE